MEPSTATEMMETLPSVSTVDARGVHSDVTRENVLQNCHICDKTFTLRRNLTRHLKMHDENSSRFTCDQCDRQFLRKDSMERHRLMHDEESTSFTCGKCDRVFLRKDKLEAHRLIHDKTYHCMHCTEIFSGSDDLKQHILSQHSVKYPCENCNESFTLKSVLRKHIRDHHRVKLIHSCEHCDKTFRSKSVLKQHLKTLHSFKPLVNAGRSTTPTVSINNRFVLTASALNTFFTYNIIPLEDYDKDLTVFLNQIRPDLIAKLTEIINEKRSIKWYIVVKVQLTRIGSDGESQWVYPNFRSNCITEYTVDNINVNITDAFAKVNQSFENFNSNGSGWTLENVMHLELSVATFKPL